MDEMIFPDRRSTMMSRLWAIEPEAMKAAFQDVPEMAAAGEGGSGRFTMTAAGSAIIQINGPMTKGENLWTMFGFATSTLAVRAALRDAVADSDVKSIMLLIDSPGGEVSGTDELAEDVRAANRAKPVHAFVDDLGASAAMWVASQAETITSNRMAMVGSIGVYTVVVDASEAFEAQGVKVHVVSTGDFKGGAFGAPVSEAQLAEVQKRVDSINVEFKAAVKRGRGMKAAALDKIADGRVFMSAEAKELGLIDSVGSFEKALGGLEKAVRARGRGSRVNAAVARVEIEKRK